MYCSAGFAQHKEGYIMPDGSKMKRNLPKGQELIKDVLENADLNALDYYALSKLGGLYYGGWLREPDKPRGEPTIDDLIQGIKFLNKAIEVAIIENIRPEAIELEKQQRDTQKRRIKSMLKVLKTAQGLKQPINESTNTALHDAVNVTVASMNLPVNEYSDEESILDKLKAHDLEDIADELKREWKKEHEEQIRIQKCEEERKKQIQKLKNIRERIAKFQGRIAHETVTIAIKADGKVVAINSKALPFGSRVVSRFNSDLNNWSDIVAVSTRGQYALGLKKDGTVVAAGYAEGLKDNRCCQTDSWRDIVAISVSSDHVVGLRSDGTVVATGTSRDSWHWHDAVAISAGRGYTVGLRSDGTVVAKGTNEDGQCNVDSWRDIVAISAGGGLMVRGHTVGLRSDGTVVATGTNGGGQCNVDSWRDIVAISAGAGYTVGLRSDGTVVATGTNGGGQCNVDSWRDIVAITSGGSMGIRGHTVGLKSDGRIVTTEVEGSEYDKYNLTPEQSCLNTTQISPMMDVSTVQQLRFDSEQNSKFQSCISAGLKFTVAVQKNGSVVAVGENNKNQCNTQSWAGVVAVAAGKHHTVGLKMDGTVCSVGNTKNGRCNINDWKNIIAVAAGEDHTVGLLSNGTVVAVGDNNYEQCNTADWENIVMISAGGNFGSFTVGLKADGTVVATGCNRDSQCNVQGWRNIVAISAGKDHTVGLKKDGTVVSTGSNSGGKCKTTSWTNIVAVVAGGNHTVGLKATGRVVAVGYEFAGQCSTNNWQDIVAIAAGDEHTIGLKTDGTVVSAGNKGNDRCSVENWQNIGIVNIDKAAFLIQTQEDQKQMLKNQQKWRDQGKCACCGGEIIKGFFGKKCKNCGVKC